MSPLPWIRLLGPLEVAPGGAPAPLPRSRKTRALLAYLALGQRDHLRARLCQLLWPGVDDPRGALRWSLSRLKPLVSGAGRLLATREAVRLETRDGEVDALRLRRLAGADPRQAPTEALVEAAALFRGDPLEGLDLPDAPDFQAWCVAQREDLRRAEIRLLDALMERLRAAPDQVVGYAHRRVRLDRADEEAHVRLIEALAAAGRGREADAHFRTHRRWLEGRGARPGPRLVQAWSAIGPEPGAPAAGQGARDAEAPPPPPSQEIRFCQSQDGVRIAWAASGQGPVLVKTANWLNHVELDWESPVWRPWLSELGRGRRLVRYDARGNGLSDWNVPELSLDAFVRDLEAVVEAAGLERYALLGMSQGCAVAVAHAVRHPERVSRLVLYGGFARGWRTRARPREIQTAEAVLTLMRHGWGTAQPTFRQLFTSLFFPGANAELMAAFNELQRRTASPENAARLGDAVGDFDVAALLRRVRVPTLVLHSRHDGLISFGEGRRLASGIPGARFVPLESANHLLVAGEPAWSRLVSELRAFLDAP
ncbi:MAG TPA: alpha/beta fold hydrolase [Anaeromyxobacteraceae bacterium]|nr:alpha/beta fold hydrolase [Anaeromyxobacteraceae bacterium]